MEIAPWTTMGIDLLQTGRYSDICIRVDNSCFKCHKIILASASDFFDKLFQKEGQGTGEVVLQETTIEIFEIFLYYIYTMDKQFLKTVNLDSIFSLMKCSRIWFAPKVEIECKEIVLKMFKKYVNEKQWIDAFEVCYLMNNRLQLNELISIMKEHNALDLPESAKLGIDSFMAYFSHTRELKESVRFRLLDLWMQHNSFEEKGIAFRLLENSEPISKKRKPSSIEEKVSLMLSKINFENMTLDEYYSGPGRSKFLSDLYKFETLFKIAKKNQAA